MLDAAIGPEWGFRLTSWNPFAPNGGGMTSVTPGASNGEGNWTQIFASGQVTVEIFGVLLQLNAGSSANQARNHLLDIGIDPAEGSSYIAIISNIVCGQASLFSDGGREFYFPVRIPSGSSVAVRIQGSHATAGSVGVGMQIFGQPKRPELTRAGQYSETIGTITNSNGVSFTPGSSGSEGSWASLGTTTRDLWWWQVGVQVDSASFATQTQFIDLAYGDVTSKVLIIEDHIIVMSASEALTSHLSMHGYKHIPAGSELFVRGRSNNASPGSGFNAVAIGVGG